MIVRFMFARKNSDMTDREKEQAKEQPQHDQTSDDFVREDVSHLVGEEIDPDSVRPIRGIDENGNPVGNEDLDEIRRGEY